MPSMAPGSTYRRYSTGMDADGMIWITGRIKDQINRGGETLSPKDIEDVLLDHPSVIEAAAFPLPHPRLGEEVAALCALRPGEAVEAAVLIEFATARLAFSQVPKTIFFADKLPRQAGSGKVSRMAIAVAYRDHPAGGPIHAAEPRDDVWASAGCRSTFARDPRSARRSTMTPRSSRLAAHLSMPCAWWPSWKPGSESSCGPSPC